MLDPNHPIAKLAREDGRYRVDAYAFVFDALNHAHSVMKMGGSPHDIETEDPDLPADEALDDDALDDEALDDEALDDEALDDEALISSDIDEEDDQVARHVSGQELCAAIRNLALEQYGHMAKCVFNSWGIHGTADFGNIVFNLIEIGQMRKTDNDRREDFDNVFDFDRELVEDFNIPLPE